jgi:hypothetical protein
MLRKELRRRGISLDEKNRALREAHSALEFITDCMGRETLELYRDRDFRSIIPMRARSDMGEAIYRVYAEWKGTGRF